MTMTSGNPQRLYLMQLSTSTLPLGAGRMLAMSSGCYLIQTSDGKNILIDSGLPADYTLPPGTPPAERTKNVLEHLADLGLFPSQIALVICTHFDVDHAGYHDAFPQAEFIVQRQHYELARSGHPRFAPARAHWDHPALRYRVIEGDTELLPGLTLTSDQRTRPWASVGAGAPAADRPGAADHRRRHDAAPVHPGSGRLAGG